MPGEGTQTRMDGPGVSEQATGRSPASAEAGRLMRLATYASVGVASALIVAKFTSWVMTDSVSLLSTLIDSLLDVAASMVSLVAVRHALTPADREHRFGHGKAEPLAALGQSTLAGTTEANRPYPSSKAARSLFAEKRLS